MNIKIHSSSSQIVQKKNKRVIGIGNSNEGYFENSIIMPITFNYSRWFPAAINNGSNVVLICDENNYISALEQTEALGAHIIFSDTPFLMK